MNEISRIQRPDGSFEIKYDDGSTYVGNLKNNQRHGVGTLSSATGEEYVGEFVDGKRHGVGTTKSRSGNKYEGDFADDLMHGSGTLILSRGIKYVGEFARGKIHGNGTMHYPDGSIYVGRFEENKRQGSGTIYRTHSLKQVGQFVNDGMDGICDLYFGEDELLYRGEYREHEAVPKKSYDKPSIKIAIIQSEKSGITDSTIAIKSRYPGCNIVTINEKTPAFQIEDLICPQKESGDEKAAASPPKKQIIIYIRGHGSEDGSLANKEFILKNLEEILEKIKSYNHGKAPVEIISRVKLNVSSCYGDTCVEVTLRKLIEKFVKAGIEVRTSAIAGDSLSVSFAGNGKNNVALKDGALGETVIVERVYAQEEACRRWVESKSAKYFNLSLRSADEVTVAKGEKHHATIDDLLSSNPKKPKEEVEPKTKRSKLAEDEENPGPSQELSQAHIRSLEERARAGSFKS